MIWILAAIGIIAVAVYGFISERRESNPEVENTVWIGAGGERVEYNEQTGEYRMVWP